MRKVIDCFTFNNEQEILQIRLHEIADLCTHIVLVEGDKYQNGQPKPFFFEENKDGHKNWLDKIVHIKVTDFPEFNQADPFLLDRHQRNAIQQGLEQIGIEEDTITLISDVDEIPRREKLSNYLENPRDFAVFQFDYRVYKYNLKCVNKIWNGTTAFRGKIVMQYPSHTLIKMRDRYDNPSNNDANLIVNAGNHLGYQSSKEEIYQKYHNAAEPFDKKNGIPPWDEFVKIYDRKVCDGGSFIFCDQPNRDDLKLEYIETLNSLPTLIRENSEKYKEGLWLPG